ncbi:MAG: hypothetical protein SGJ27_21130 [Candidatus Melainabacteria bacterium]|nr:hypothetical protein [Candidatus Melainabacteria bacterium]
MSNAPLETPSTGGLSTTRQRRNTLGIVARMLIRPKQFKGKPFAIAGTARAYETR